MTATVSQPLPHQSPTPEIEPTPIRWVTLLFFAGFHLVALLGIFCFSWSALGVALLLHWCFGGLGICLGYHRLLSHRSFVVPKWLEYVIAMFGVMAIQGGPIFWTAGHRQHHAFTEDKNKDPYSVERGFWWSHMQWLFSARSAFFKKEEYYPLAPDLAKDPFYRFLDRYFLLLQVPLAIVLYLLGGWSFVIYGIFVRSILVWHATWFVNSATHTWGYRRYDCDDNSRNLWWVALITYGEGWHNNHHAYPKCAKAGLTWWEVDTTYWVIWLLSKAGLATRVNLNTAEPS